MTALSFAAAVAWGALAAWLFLGLVGRAARASRRTGLVRPLGVAALLVAPGVVSPALVPGALAGFVVAKSLLLGRAVRRAH